jgi:hypothetical protein
MFSFDWNERDRQIGQFLMFRDVNSEEVVLGW